MHWIRDAADHVERLIQGRCDSSEDVEAFADVVEDRGSADSEPARQRCKSKSLITRSVDRPAKRQSAMINFARRIGQATTSWARLLAHPPPTNAQLSDLGSSVEVLVAYSHTVTRP